MATRAPENRTERVVVLMTPGEKATLVERALVSIGPAFTPS
jgi:hypothetical protein